MQELIEQIKALAFQNHRRVVSYRRTIHQNPELSFEEYNTALYIEKCLKELGIEHFRLGNTGVIADIGNSGPTIALRADIDALPIFEQNNSSYVSTNPGIMHACGHDAHTASLLGAAFILQEIKDKIPGRVRLIFQPGEEKAPGGASVLIKQGVLDHIEASHIIGQHVLPFLPAGKVGFRPGKYMASADELYFTVKGKGGHAAMPENLIDPILVSSHIITGLQSIVSRRANPKIPTVLSFGKIIGMGASNIIPNEVNIEGTFRTFDEQWRHQALEIIDSTAQGIAHSFGAQCEVKIVHGYPFLKNDEELTLKLKSLAKSYLGDENVVELDQWMASEDFAFYTHQVPGCFYRLGTGNIEKKITSGVHTPTFDIDEEALLIGSGLFACLAVTSFQNT